jgi:hypothetical protein
LFFGFHPYERYDGPIMAAMAKLKVVSAESVMNIAWFMNPPKELYEGYHIELR